MYITKPEHQNSEKTYHQLLNCTQQLQQLNITDQQLAIECQKLGLDEFSASRLRAGSVICNITNGSNQYIQLKNGELVVSSQPLGADHDLIDNGLWQCAQSM